MKLNKYFSCSDVSRFPGVLLSQLSVNSLKSRTKSNVILIINLVEVNLEKTWRVTCHQLRRRSLGDQKGKPSVGTIRDYYICTLIIYMARVKLVSIIYDFEIF